MGRGGKRGVWLVLGLFAVGGAVLWGLFLAPRAVSPPPPPRAVFGAPDRPVRIVSFNILHNQRGIDNVVADIKAFEPDILLLQEVESRDVIGLAERLGMRRQHHPRMYERSVNLAGPRASWANLILSKVPVYEAGSIPNPGGGSFGVWGTAVVGDRKFIVANVHLSATWNANPKHLQESGVNRHKELTSLFDAWKRRGSPPIVVGGDFNQIPMGNNYALMEMNLTDALGSLGKTDTTFGQGLLRTRIDYFLISAHWRTLDGGVGSSGASDHEPIWVVVAGKDADDRAATTKAVADGSAH
jgi:endonuclease/exonuclease/phosphatase family metal-dependent hydrolase